MNSEPDWMEFGSAPADCQEQEDSSPPRTGFFILPDENPENMYEGAGFNVEVGGV